MEQSISHFCAYTPTTPQNPTFAIFITFMIGPSPSKILPYPTQLS